MLAEVNGMIATTTHTPVAAHDVSLRVGDGPDATAVCSDVLTDIALRWWWFELLRSWFARPDPAGGYLGGAVVRRVGRARWPSLPAWTGCWNWWAGPGRRC